MSINDLLEEKWKTQRKKAFEDVSRGGGRKMGAEKFFYHEERQKIDRRRRT
jgi:hypothetical protein